jgi:hypothetical protein
METPKGDLKTVESIDWEKVMTMPTKELLEYLRSLPPKQADEIREARKRAARRAYRERHLSEEKRRQADWYRRRMAALKKDPEQLALFRARDAARKRVERAGKQQSEEPVRSSRPVSTRS